jgi:DNA-binding transcriptional ArsR family regulator
VNPRGEQAASGGGPVLLSVECRPLRRSLRPLVWVILEEVALDAVAEDGRLVARTSARQIAERLGIDPGTAASALAALRERDLVSSSREEGSDGRFGLSVYELHPVAGVSVVRPCPARPRVVPPSMAAPPMEEPGVAAPCVGAPHLESSGLESPDSDHLDRRAGGTIAVPDPSGVGHAEGSSRLSSGFRRPAEPGSSPQCRGQESFDLGSVSS